MPHPAIRQDAGQVALQRGPVIYCLEEADNGARLANVVLPRSIPLTVEQSDLFGGASVITGEALRIERANDFKRTISTSVECSGSALDIPLYSDPVLFLGEPRAGRDAGLAAWGVDLRKEDNFAACRSFSAFYFGFWHRRWFPSFSCFKSGI